MTNISRPHIISSPLPGQQRNIDIQLLLILYWIINERTQLNKLIVFKFMLAIVKNTTIKLLKNKLQISQHKCIVLQLFQCNCLLFYR